jgi:PAT family beta-lactamase induction signal transducer AmpG
MEAKTAWANALFTSAVAMAAFGVYHLVVLPTGSLSRRPKDVAEVVATFQDTVAEFLKKKALIGMLTFVFLYRSAEGLLLIEAPLFLQAPIEEGGLGLSLTDKGLIDGTISTIVTIVGGLLGGAFVSRFGLKKTLFVLALTVNVPNVCFVYLSQVVSADNPVSFTTVAVLASIEKFGYGFGFVGNMLYMMQQIAPGKYRMTHYAFATARMNLVLVPTQMASGPLADWLGYRSFFIFVMVATIPSLIAAWFAPFPNDPGGGVEESEEDSVELDADALAAQA